jgi:hypothetical protein
MPRIIVTTDPPQMNNDPPVLLDERVHSVHLSTGHAAAQLVERLAWAISDAENAEGGSPAPRARSLRESTRRPHATRPRARPRIGA